MLSDGTFMMLSGGTDLGTGLDTVSVKFAAETLAVDMGKISILAGDTDVTPFDVGAYASSGTYFSGGAAQNAALNMRRRILEVASVLTGEKVEDLHLVYRAGSGSGEVGHLSGSYLPRPAPVRSTDRHRALHRRQGFVPGAHFTQWRSTCARAGEDQKCSPWGLRHSVTELALESEMFGRSYKTIGL